MAEEKKRKSKKTPGGGSSKDPVIEDPRFSNIHSDPRYRLPSKRQTHVKLDKRFAHMLREKDFSRNAAVDRYGRKLARDDTTRQLKKFYRLDEDDEDSRNERQEDKEGGGEEEGGGGLQDLASEISIDNDEDVQRELAKVEWRVYDPARDGGFSESSSSEEDSSSDEESDDLEDGLKTSGVSDDEFEFPEKQLADVPVGEVTERIAIVNLDWDNIRAEDLMAVFSSFLPPGGRVIRVSVYPSEFGKERIEREEIEGPPREIFAARKKPINDEVFDDDDDEEEGEEELDSDEEEERIKESILKEDTGEEYNSTELRRYQLERLRYFYAIITFSSKEVAKHVYDQVDGAEYLSSANFFDLRFVPEETDFSDDRPRDDCERMPDGYKPTDFVTDALQHSKVKLAWDADDKSRKEAQARAFRGSRKEIDENDLKAYLGSDSSDDEQESIEIIDVTADAGSSTKLTKKEAERQRMRALLGLSSEAVKPSKSDGPSGELEVTFTSGLAGASNKDSVFENEPENDETTIEKYVRKERERKKRRKEKMKALKRGEAVPESGTEVEKDSRNELAAAKTRDESQEDLGFNDPFFDGPDGTATPSARRKQEKRKKREERAAEEASLATQRAELELLMLDDNKTAAAHFDMNEIEKAEKQARKKKGRGKKNNAEEPSAADDFQMEVNDPRFSRLYDSHEFAIDPTDPRFKGTSGMKALLEEGRKRRRNRGDHEVDVEIEQGNKKQRKANEKEQGGHDDWKGLVDKVKRKVKAV